MSKPEWGEKRICPSCSLKYYDFNKLPIKCPSCNIEFDPDLLLKSRKGRGFPSKIDEKENNEEASASIEKVSKDDIEELETVDNEMLTLEESDIDEELGTNLEKDLGKEIDDNEEDEIISENNEIEFMDEKLDDDTSVSIEIEEDEDKD